MADEFPLQDMAQELLDAVSAEDADIDDGILQEAEGLILAHNLFVQLMAIDLILERTQKLPVFFETLDNLAEEIGSDEQAEMSPTEKVRAVTAFTAATKVQLETINTMMASKEASGALISSLRENFAGRAAATGEQARASVNIMDRLRAMKPADRQRILRGLLSTLRNMPSSAGPDGEG